MSDKQDKSRLRRVAELIYEQLQADDAASGIIWSSRLGWCDRTYTDGWYIKLGNLGRNKPRLELWLDRWPHRPLRYFWYAFYSPQARVIEQLMKRLPPHLRPFRDLSAEDFERASLNIWRLVKPLSRESFSRPIYEHYYGQYFFYGMYDANPSQQGLSERMVASRAAAFFLDVLREMPQAAPRTEASGIYQAVENRQSVVQHVQRERDGFLATERKIRDKYQCQVCRMRFENVYGKLGEGFAEAHHIIPLSRLKGVVKTTFDDLITVCANCHRILHRMDGKRDDIKKLRAIVRSRSR